tara:strand:+ start:88 stop:996 length:909 start_codon:yes stop_codon:yes gene_type:complete
MSKLNVDEIESNTTNSNVKVNIVSDSGACEIKAATNDATLQLNCSANSHGVKIKAPANSAGQNYTMLLPDNQIAANKFLKVKSVTGTVGQLEFANAAPDLSSLNASNLTSGTLPAARLPNSFTGASGASLELVAVQTVGSTAVTSITFTGIEDDTMYKMIGTHLQTQNSSNLSYSDSSQFYMHWLDSAGNRQSQIMTQRYYYDDVSNPDVAEDDNNDTIKLYNDGTITNICFVADIYNKAEFNWMTLWGFSPSRNSYSMFEIYSTFSNTALLKRIYGIEISVNTNRQITEGSQVLLYKYKET